MKNTVISVLFLSLLLLFINGCNVLSEKANTSGNRIELKPITKSTSDYQFKLYYTGSLKVLETVSFEVVVLDKNKDKVNNGDVEIQLGMNNMGHSELMKTKLIKPGTFVCSGDPSMDGEWQISIHYYINGLDVISGMYNLNITK